MGMASDVLALTMDTCTCYITFHMGAVILHTLKLCLFTNEITQSSLKSEKSSHKETNTPAYSPDYIYNLHP